MCWSRDIRCRHVGAAQDEDRLRDGDAIDKKSSSVRRLKVGDKL